MKTYYPPELKEEVVNLGLNGHTYAQIQEIYPIPQGTLSYWFKKVGGIRTRERQLEDLARAREAAVRAVSNGKQERLVQAQEAAQETLATLPLENEAVLKALLAMLYWAEGTKSDNAVTVFTNTDPKLILLYTTLMRTAYSLDESKFRIGLRVHHYHSPSEARAFWSDLLNIPESQFGKICVKKRSTQRRFRENFQGICTVIYHDVQIRRELLSFGELIADAQKLSSFNG